MTGSGGVVGVQNNNKESQEWIEASEWLVWHLPVRGPVGPAARCAAKSNVEVGRTTYLVKGEG